MACSVNRRFEITACGPDCRLVAGHPGACQSSTRKGKAERATLRKRKA